MFKFIATTILCILIHPLWAQEVSNVQVQQNGDELMVSFDIAGPCEEYLVEIEIAEDGEIFKIFGGLNGRRGKNQFRAALKELVYSPNCIFRISSNIRFISDVDGNVYTTIKIGKQFWMKENLKVSKYRNGDRIPTNLKGALWFSTTSGAYTDYYDPANNSIYGKLYNWYAVSDPRGLCPVGWHVPTDSEWYILENFLDPTVNDPTVRGNLGRDLGGKLKADTSYWSSPNTGATNSSGFTALPGGNRIFGVGYFGDWWSSSEYSSTSAWYRYLFYGNAYSRRDHNSKCHGCSIRCLKD